MTARSSIVIPVHGRAALTRQCLDTLLAQDLPGTEIVVVDDASPDDTASMLASYGDRVRVIGLAENHGFAGACNQGVAAATGDDVVLLNNDTRPSAGWLGHLTAYADGHPEAGLVGSKLLWPTGSVQHAGVVVDADKEVRHIYMGFPGDHPAVNRARRFQIVTAACVLIRRELFDSLGGFDRAFRNGYEDVDFCLRAGQEGQQIHYCPQSVVYHLESASRGYETEIDRANRDLYRSRWADRITQDDIAYYLEDGLVELSYDWLSVNLKVSPMLGSCSHDGEGTVVERTLTWRSRQCFDLIRENARLSLSSDMPAPWGSGGSAPPPARPAPRAAAPRPPRPATREVEARVPTVEARVPAVEVEQFKAQAGRYDEWPSGEPYDWGGATRGDSPYDNLDFHVDLGCGNAKKGRIGIDIFPAPGVNVVCDLDRLETFAVAGPGQDAELAGPDSPPIHRGSLPLADSSIESMVAHHCLEHLGQGFVPLMDECWRALKPGGYFRVIVPLFPSWGALVDPDHSRFFVGDADSSTFDYFCGTPEHCWMESFAVPYTRARFEKVEQAITPRSKDPDDWWTARDAREMRVTLRAVK